jgi:hypothetical protein
MQKNTYIHVYIGIYIRTKQEMKAVYNEDGVRVGKKGPPQHATTMQGKKRGFTQVNECVHACICIYIYVYKYILCMSVCMFEFM